MNEEDTPHNASMSHNRTDPTQSFALRFGNLQVPVQIQDRLPLGRNVSNMAQGFLPSLAQSQYSGNPSTLPSSVVSEPSAVIDMSPVNPLNSQASIRSGVNALYSQGQGHSHGQGHGHIHNHGHSHSQGHGHSHSQNPSHLIPVQDENQNHNGLMDNQANALNELQQSDWRPFLLWFQKSGIFFVLLFIKLMYDHRLGLLVFFALGGTFYYANMKLTQFIHRTAVRESRTIWSHFQPLWLIVFMSANISILYYVFSDQHIWRVLMFGMPTVGEVDVWTLLWVVLLTDYILKFATIILKSLVAVVPVQCFPHKKRGKYFMFLEMLSQCYRQLVPIIPWMHFLTDDQHSAPWFGVLCVIIYSVFKLSLLWGQWKDLFKAFKRLRVQTNFGTKPSPSDLKKRGEQCPICQDDYKEPVMLTCKHVFCEDCVTLWFDRERTCPMCRAQVTDNPHFQDGSTSPHLQWY